MPEHYKYNLVSTEEGFFILGKKSGLVRKTTAEATDLSWYDTGIKHGKSIVVNATTGRVERTIYKFGNRDSEFFDFDFAQPF